MTNKVSIKKLKKQENLMGYIFASPWLIGIIVFGGFPILASLYISFTRYDMVSSPQWVGIQNYIILYVQKIKWYTFAIFFVYLLLKENKNGNEY